MAKGGGASSARRCALRVVARVFEDGAYADRAFEAEARRFGLDGRERAFAQQLAYGTVQRRATLDHLIARLASRPVSALDPPLRDALRLGVLQLAFLDGAPVHAAVDQTVELAKAGPRGGDRLVNAVMRRAAREARALLAELDDETPEGAALVHSHPEWIARLWWEALGAEEARALLARDNEAPESALRANELVTSAAELAGALEAQGVPTRPAELLPEGLVAEGRFDAHGSELFREGRLTPQSRASMLVSRVVAPRPGERVLDACAAPGAKTTHLAALMGGRGTLVALERDRARSGQLARNCERMAAGFVDVRHADATRGLGEERFDRVLVDAPCSALGTLQARPDARWRRSPERLDELVALQGRLLVAAAAAVAPGGTLVFSTCTISPRENERAVLALLARASWLGVDDLGAELPGYRLRADPRFLQILPHRDGTDGFFIARLRRET